MLLCGVYFCSVWIRVFFLPNKKYYMILLDLEHNLDFMAACSPLTIVSFVVDYRPPKQFTPGSGGHRSRHNPPCTSCQYPGACPWCHVR